MIVREIGILSSERKTACGLLSVSVVHVEFAYPAEFLFLLSPLPCTDMNLYKSEYKNRLGRRCTYTTPPEVTIKALATAMTYGTAATCEAETTTLHGAALRHSTTPKHCLARYGTAPYSEG